MNFKFVLLATGAVCIGVVAVAQNRWEARSSSASIAERRMQSAIVDAERVLELRSARAVIAAGKRPDADVITRVSAALSRAGVPTRSLRDVGQASDLAVSGESRQRRVQSVRFTLGSISLSQLGEFLGAWRSAEGTWGVTRIELTTAARLSAVSASYDATLTISTIYIVQDERP